MQTVLITGTGGFVGTYLISLLAQDYKIIACSRSPLADAIFQPNIYPEILDFRYAEEVNRLVQKHKPHFVVHAGAMSKPDDCELNKELAYETNVTGTKNLLQAALKHNSFFLFLSTDFVFDGISGFYKEDDPTGIPVNYYGHTKLLAEQAVTKYTHAWSIVRTVLVYGKPLAGRHNILTLVKEKLGRGEGYNVFDDQVRTPTYVEDLVHAIKTIIDYKKEGLFHISGEDVFTPYGIAVEVARYLGKDERLLNKTDQKSFIQSAMRPLKTGFNITKAKTELNYKPTPFS